MQRGDAEWNSFFSAGLGFVVGLTPKIGTWTRGTRHKKNCPASLTCDFFFEI